MSEGNDWVVLRIAEASKGHPKVTPAVLARVQGLMNATMLERSLAGAELTFAATLLLDEMVSSDDNEKEPS
jgi:hypothetical protein